MITFRVMATWEFGGGQLGPVDVEGVKRDYGTERNDAIWTALCMFRNPSSHGNVENIVVVEVTQDEIDELYMDRHPAAGPGHLAQECPCIIGKQSVAVTAEGQPQGC